MNEKRNCKIIQDLLPNYIEKLTNNDTNQFIEEHLNECDVCREIYNNMKKDVDINTNKREISKWFNLNKKAGIRCIAADVEDNECAKLIEENKEFPRSLYRLSKYIVNKADDLGLKFLFYNNFWYLYYNTQAKRDLYS